MNIVLLMAILSCTAHIAQAQEAPAPEMITQTEIVPQTQEEHTPPSPAEIEAQIENRLATYPVTYNAQNNAFNISTITATNPDRNESITGITHVIFHKKFHPEKSFESQKFDHTRSVKFKRDNKMHNGYIESASKINDTWMVSIKELTATHPKTPSFPRDIRPQMPATKNQIAVDVTPKSKDEIRKELRAELSR